MKDFQIDARNWGFLDNPAGYLNGNETDLQIGPLKRQFLTAKEILSRFNKGRGVLLADDVGLGKTTVGVLVAWVVACQGKRVRIYVPNAVLRRRWAEEFERHVPLLKQIGASYDRIKASDIKRLNAGQIQVSTHHALVRSHKNNEQRTACDLMIIDEAHRAKGERSAFNTALSSLGGHASRKLFLTATPFSIKLAELEQMLRFVGAEKLDAVRQYASELTRLYALGDGHDIGTESDRLVRAAKAAIDELQPYLIRHEINDLSKAEQKHFGVLGTAPWSITTTPLSPEGLKLLLRMDRLLRLTSKRQGERSNDPRFHIGWQHVSTELNRAESRVDIDHNPTAQKHIKEAKKSLRFLRKSPHPKALAVSNAIRPLLDAGEKVLVFCHHRATAGELLGSLEQSLRVESILPAGPPVKVWRLAWESLLSKEKIWPDEEHRPVYFDKLMTPILDWFCSPGLRWQISGWLVNPAQDQETLAKQLEAIRPRGVGVDKKNVATISQAASTLIRNLLDKESTSTLALLRSIARGTNPLGGKCSHFPGRLDDCLRVMGSWEPNGDGESPPPETLYTGASDIVLAIFNSPFGPDVLVTTDRLSEGVDLHRCCRYLIHYELDPSPVRTLQRNGRIRRVGSWAALTQREICYAYPIFGGTRDEKAVDIMRQRINAFGLLLGGVPSLDHETSDSEQSFADTVLRLSSTKLKTLNRKLGVLCRQYRSSPVKFETFRCASTTDEPCLS